MPELISEEDYNYDEGVDKSLVFATMILLELVARPRFNQTGVGDSPPLFIMTDMNINDFTTQPHTALHSIRNSGANSSQIGSRQKVHKTQDAVIAMH